jgi:hypothetical protein
MYYVLIRRGRVVLTHKPSSSMKRQGLLLYIEGDKAFGISTT